MNTRADTTTTSIGHRQETGAGMEDYQAPDPVQALLAACTQWAGTANGRDEAFRVLLTGALRYDQRLGFLQAGGAATLTDLLAVLSGLPPATALRSQEGAVVLDGPPPITQTGEGWADLQTIQYSLAGLAGDPSLDPALTETADHVRALAEECLGAREELVEYILQTLDGSVDLTGEDVEAAVDALIAGDA